MDCMPDVRAISENLAWVQRDGGWIGRVSLGLVVVVRSEGSAGD